MTGPTGGEVGTAGFGLIEVLVALVVLSAGLLGAAALSTAVEDQRRRAARETARTLVAQQVLDSLRGAGFTAAESGEAELRMAGRTWPVSWRVDGVAPRLKAVEVRIPGAGRADRALTVRSRLHRLRVPLSPRSGGGP